MRHKILDDEEDDVTREPQAAITTQLRDIPQEEPRPLNIEDDRSASA